MDQVEAGLDDRKWRTGFLDLLKRAGDTHPLLTIPEEPSHEEYDAIRAVIELVVHIDPARADHFEIQHRGGDPMRQDEEEDEDWIYFAGSMQQLIKSFRLDFHAVPKVKQAEIDQWSKAIGRSLHRQPRACHKR
ncbi:hypothetical protein V866_006306 [Kwoniella sp. B9012]